MHATDGYIMHEYIEYEYMHATNECIMHRKKLNCGSTWIFQSNGIELSECSYGDSPALILGVVIWAARWVRQKSPSS